MLSSLPQPRLTTRFLDTPPVEEETLGDLVDSKYRKRFSFPSMIRLGYACSPLITASRLPENIMIASRRDYIDSLLNEWPDDLLQPTQLSPDFWGYYEYLLAPIRRLQNRPSWFHGRATVPR
jgi:hypothetical protein